VKASVEGYVTAILESADSDSPGAERRAAGAAAGGAAAELDALHRLVESNPRLRIALTDTAVPAAARRELIDDLLHGRVSEPTRRAAVFVAGAVFPPEVPAGIEWVASRARRFAEGDPLPVATLGHLPARDRVGGFATALFEELSTAELEEVEDELFRFARTLDAAPALRTVLSDRDLPPDARKSIVDELLRDKVRPATLRLVKYTLEGGRARDLVGTLDFLVERAAKARGWRVARVRAGREIDAEQRDRLSSSLTALAGQPVELQVTVDPTLLAGVLVQVGDVQVDASVRGRLDHLREHLFTHDWQARGFDLTDGSNPGTSRGSS
jgi:F-type H+-transporting ATPase subunit delta